jgi:hypothetical protein
MAHRASICLSTSLLLLHLLGACTPERSDAPDASPEDAARDVGTTTDAGPLDASADSGGAAPLIHEAGLCDERSPDLSVAPGTDLLKVTLDDPDAVCADGSPAVVYVRPAPAGSANPDRWLVWLESGGGCNSPAACRARWCGATIGKMTSRFAPDGVRMGGVFDTRADNDFADWNHVVAYYCSSDSWSGRQRTLAVDATGATPPYELFVHGAYIVDAIFDTLKRGAVSDDRTMTLPSLDDASMLLFTGSSAGAGGVRSNADRIGEVVRATNPDVDYRVVVDAGFFPADPAPPALPEADALAALDFKHEAFTTWRNGDTDASCLAYHAGDPRWCSDNTHLIQHHVTTPAFIKQDLRDGAPGVYSDAQDYSRAIFDVFSRIDDGTFAPDDPGVPIAQTGLFAPSCDHHLALNGANFYDVAITNGADALSMHDLLSNWVEGTQPTRAIHEPTSGLASVCP